MTGGQGRRKARNPPLRCCCFALLFIPPPVLRFPAASRSLAVHSCRILSPVTCPLRKYGVPPCRACPDGLLWLAGAARYGRMPSHSALTTDAEPYYCCACSILASAILVPAPLQARVRYSAGETCTTARHSSRTPAPLWKVFYWMTAVVTTLYTTI